MQDGPSDVSNMSLHCVSHSDNYPRDLKTQCMQNNEVDRDPTEWLYSTATAQSQQQLGQNFESSNILFNTMFYGQRREYNPVAQDALHLGDCHGRRSGLLFVSITALVSGLLGFAGGSLFSTSHSDRSLNTIILHEPGVNIREIYTGIDTTFTYNRTFGADPEVDTATLEAWNSMVPRTSATLL